jgi:ABC-2 type transport system ATP-binding protein
MNAIEAWNLSKTYKGGVRALAGLSFAVDPGTIFALLGPNGAGKSTAVKILTTLSRADSGEARVAGLDVVRDADRVRRSIGVVGQRPGLDPDATGRENLEMQAELYGLSGARRRERAGELLDRLGLAAAADRLAKTYSGGMQRRLDVALGLVHRPKVLFLDEPTTGLDPEARAQLWREIERLAATEEMTILLTTHYLEEADRLAAELAIVDHGRIVAAGTPEQLKSELRGDTVQVELLDPGDGKAAATTARVSGLTEVTFDGRLLRARAANGAAAIPSLITALERSGLTVASATIARPSLDDVYLRHAGRSFAHEDTQTNREASEVAA